MAKKKDIVIPETEQPKVDMIGVRVSKGDKQIIETYCKTKNYRPSAFMRVLALGHIKNDEDYLDEA